MTEKTVGIMGGMGPDATLELMQRIIKATPAEDDVDHIHMLIDNNPKIPSRIKALLEGAGEDPTPALIHMAQGLEHAGADFLVIPCNTVHHYHSAIQESVTIPVWNLIDITLSHVSKNFKATGNAGFLASTAVRKIRLFEPWCQKYKLDPLFPEEQDQKIIMSQIRAIKAAGANKDLTDQYLKAVKFFADTSACDVLILGCSELSTIHKLHPQNLNVIDPLQVLAEAVVHYCKQR